MKSRFTIGSRGSRLALWQAEWAKSALETAHPHLTFGIEIITTSGDTMKDAPLTIIGGQGVFIKELEDALITGRIDFAVHSLKDLPTVVPDGLFVAAITVREDARDALILRQNSGFETEHLASLAPAAVVGTSSPRRFAQLKHLCRERPIKDLRGNIDTRLRKLDEGQYDAVILAAAGLRRLGWAKRIHSYLDLTEMLPAVGQGALGIETRSDDGNAISIVKILDHSQTRDACTSERGFLRALGGGCQLPIAGHASVKGDALRLEGLVAEVNGETIIRDSIEGKACDAERLGTSLAERLLSKGAASLIDAGISVT